MSLTTKLSSEYANGPTADINQTIHNILGRVTIDDPSIAMETQLFQSLGRPGN